MRFSFYNSSRLARAATGPDVQAMRRISTRTNEMAASQLFSDRRCAQGCRTGSQEDRAFRMLNGIALLLCTPALVLHGGLGMHARTDARSTHKRARTTLTGKGRNVTEVAEVTSVMSVAGCRRGVAHVVDRLGHHRQTVSHPLRVRFKIAPNNLKRSGSRRPPWGYEGG